jgi:hypothetical protein
MPLMLINMSLEAHRQEDRGIKGYTDIFKPVEYGEPDE